MGIFSRITWDDFHVSISLLSDPVSWQDDTYMWRARIAQSVARLALDWLDTSAEQVRNTLAMASQKLAIGEKIFSCSCSRELPRLCFPHYHPPPPPPHTHTHYRKSGECKISRHYINSTPLFQYICNTILGNCLFSRHCITSTPQFQSVWSSCWVGVYSSNIISSLPLHTNLYILLGKIQSICIPSWIFVYTPDMTSPLPNHSNLYFPFWAIVYSQDIRLPLQHYSNLYVPLLGKNPISLCILLGICLFSRHYITSHSFQYICTPLISSLPLHCNLYVPLFGKCLFSRHYIISTPQFQSICTPSSVTAYSQDIISPLPLYSNLYVPPFG